MTIAHGLIEDLEDAIARKDMARRASAMHLITDLFMTGTAQYSAEMVSVFDDVMKRLVEEVDEAARVAVAVRLATRDDAPPAVLRRLALDEAPEVAVPVLEGARALDEATLIESARTRSQAHLLAIAQRASLSEAVTDVLVVRGDQRVVQSAAVNPGARFSPAGFGTMVERAQEDEKLAMSIWRRPDLPRPIVLKLFAEASALVQRKLEALDRRKVDTVREMVAQAAARLQTQARESSPSFIAARTQVEALHASGRLDLARLIAFAMALQFDEATVAMATLCALPVVAIERALVADQTDQIIVLCKSLGMDWDGTRAVIAMQRANNRAIQAPDSYLPIFSRLQVETARRALEFYRLRERAAAALG